jgi:nitric oxide reductase large subunit
VRAVLIAITVLAYRNAPPISARVVGADGAARFQEMAGVRSKLSMD